MGIVSNNEFCELSLNEKNDINGGAVGGAALGVVVGAGMGMLVGAIKSTYTNDSSDIWKTSAKWALKNGIKGAFLPF
ncbi:MAG: Blp family class II bacteriocin [Lachnospira sp.]